MLQSSLYPKSRYSMNLFAIMVIGLHLTGIMKWFLWERLHSNAAIPIWKFIFVSFLLTAEMAVEISLIYFSWVKKDTVLLINSCLQIEGDYPEKGKPVLALIGL